MTLTKLILFLSLGCFTAHAMNQQAAQKANAVNLAKQLCDAVQTNN